MVVHRMERSSIHVVKTCNDNIKLPIELIIKLLNGLEMRGNINPRAARFHEFSSNYCFGSIKVLFTGKEIVG